MSSKDISPELMPHMAANALRVLAMDAIQQANSGHPGMPMGMADIATMLWTRFHRFNPANPGWLDRDRFVLSNGHGSMLLYGLLHLTGHALSMEELRNFRQLSSKTPGHPEYGHTPGVETTTGPLGQGVSTAVGMALAERMLADRFNRPGHEMINHRTWVFVGDGCLMEGISHEACSLAGHLGLGRLIVFFDDNKITIDGSIQLSSSDDVRKRFEAYNWHVIEADGHDQEALAKATEQALKEDSRPTLVICPTIIGWGSPNKAGTAATHGSPLGAEEIEATRKALGWEWPAFEVPDPVREHWEAAGGRGAEAEKDWQNRLADYCKAHPEAGAELTRISQGKPSEAWKPALNTLRESWLSDPPDGDATRSASGKVLAAIGPTHPDLVGGSADLTPSNNTHVGDYQDISPGKFGGKYIRYGIREHGMAAVMNGLALHGGTVPYAGTFLVFSDYLRPALRLSALMNQQVIHVLTHDSIGLGEDGPTHQPVEHYAALRSIPGLDVFRPADIRETLESWEAALERTNGPSALLLTRQKVPTLEGTGKGGVAKGGYTLADAPEGTELKALLMASGSEVQLALKAREILAGEGIGARVISMPCLERFLAQAENYRLEVLPLELNCGVAVETGVAQGWGNLPGLTGRVIGMNSFGGSAPAEQLYETFGITAEAIVEAVKAQL